MVVSTDLRDQKTTTPRRSAILATTRPLSRPGRCRRASVVVKMGMFSSNVAHERLLLEIKKGVKSARREIEALRKPQPPVIRRGREPQLEGRRPTGAVFQSFP